MNLTLEVTGPETAALGQGRRHTFSTQGGVIGRARSSDWMLSHTKVSGRHAVISYMDGVFYIEDTSTNGVFINSSKNRLVQGRRYALQSGDRILIDPYEIDVTVSDEAVSPRTERFDDVHHRPAGKGGFEDPFAIDDPFEPARGPVVAPRNKPTHPGSPEPVAAEEVDPLKLLGSDSKRTPPRRQGPTAENLDRSAVAGHYAPPAIIPPPPPLAPAPGSMVIPEDYDPLSDDFIEPARPTPVTPPEPSRPTPRAAVEAPPPPPVTPPPFAPPRPPPRPQEPIERAFQESAEPDTSAPDLPMDTPATRDPGAVVAELLAGAGLTNIPSTPELAGSFGQIFRVVVEGVMDVLRSRQQIKDEFRMRMTQFRPADNNPLKFSANVDDALHNLLVKRNPAYLGPVEAFEDAFDDLRNHQLAMLEGMRVAFEAMLAEFDPDRLEKQFDRQLKRAPLLGAIARYRYWDLYRDLREELAKDPDARFKRLFGEEFARAYEEQLNRLKTESRARRAADETGQS